MVFGAVFPTCFLCPTCMALRNESVVLREDKFLCPLGALPENPAFNEVSLRSLWPETIGSLNREKRRHIELGLKGEERPVRLLGEDPKVGEVIGHFTDATHQQNCHLSKEHAPLEACVHSRNAPQVGHA